MSDTDFDIPESRDKRLNRMVALTVVFLSVFMAVANIKDDNLVQAMALAKSDAVDSWNEYEATKTKQHIAETARAEIAVLGGDRPNVATMAAMADYDRTIAKYKAESPRLAQKAKAHEGEYDALNIHDDQFDMCDALISIAISLAGVAALAETRWLLFVAWGFGGFGVLMGVAGFAGWALHPDMLAGFLS